MSSAEGIAKGCSGNLTPDQISSLEEESAVKLFELPGGLTEIRASPLCVFTLEFPVSRAIYLISGLGFSDLKFLGNYWLLSR